MHFNLLCQVFFISRLAADLSSLVLKSWDGEQRTDSYRSTAISLADVTASGYPGVDPVFCVRGNEMIRGEGGIFCRVFSIIEAFLATTLKHLKMR